MEVKAIPKNTYINLSTEKKQRIIEASLNEFALRSYEEVKISNIIKEAKIARGSFYQYFIDKADLYEYIFDLIAKEKMIFLGDILPNTNDLPFLEIFHILYRKGVEFAYSNPRYMEIGKHLFNLKGEMYDRLIGDGLKIAKQYYIGYIENDKLKGRIRDDVDSDVFADLVVRSTTNITINEMDGNDVDLERILLRVDSLINILKKGIE